MKPITNHMSVAVIGLGGRGRLYSNHIMQRPDEMRITAVADCCPDNVRNAKERYNLTPEQCFGSAEELFAREKLADVAIIATQDRQHYGHAMAAMERGYHLLLEKPISPILSECIKIRDEALRRGLAVAVCHSMRYAPFFRRVKELVSSGAIGKVLSVDLVENIGYWHMAHSYVRGHWRDSKTSSPLILAKSCHDMDFLHYLMDTPCTRLSSYGKLSWFRRENAPYGAAQYCMDAAECRASCPYDAEKIYIDRHKDEFATGKVDWPATVVTANPTEHNLREALKSGQYGRCVYHCDNNVADHQVIAMDFANGATATFTVSAFTPSITRQIKIMGSMGELTGDAEKTELFLTRFGQKPELADIGDTSGSHGGGDAMLINNLRGAIMDGGSGGLTGIDKSVHSHVMALAAEHSRLNGGEVVDIAAFEQKQDVSG